MSKELVKCPICDEPFNQDDGTIEVRGEYYHEDCVVLYPTVWCAFDGEEYLGVTENDKGDPAFLVLDEGEYIEEEE